MIIVGLILYAALIAVIAGAFILSGRADDLDEQTSDSIAQAGDCRLADVLNSPVHSERF